MNPILALIITNVIWGAASPIFKYALTNIPPFSLAFIRFFFASLLFLPWIKKTDWVNFTKRDWLNLFLGGFFGIVINISFFFLGVQKTESINVPIIGSAGPLLIFIFSIIFLKEKIRLKVLSGMILAFIGVMGVILSPFLFNGKTINHLGEFEGNLMIVLATLGAVLAPIFIKKIINKTRPVFISGVQFFISSFFFLPFAINEFKTWDFSQINQAGIVGIIYGVFFSSALAYYLLAYGLSKISAQEVGLFMYIDPLAAIVVAVPLLKEYPDIYFVISTILVLGGIFIAEKRIHYHPFHKLIKITNNKYQITNQ